MFITLVMQKVRTIFVVFVEVAVDVAVAVVVVVVVAAVVSASCVK